MYLKLNITELKYLNNRKLFQKITFYMCNYSDYSDF